MKLRLVSNQLLLLKSTHFYVLPCGSWCLPLLLHALLPLCLTGNSPFLLPRVLSVQKSYPYLLLSY